MLAAVRERRVVFVEDESTFSLTPYTTRGWYPRGKAVFVELSFLRSNRFYVFGVSNGSKEHYRFFDGRKLGKKKRCINSRMTIKFLGYLHCKYPKLLLFWDEASNHGSRLTRAYCNAHDIKTIEFPTASPELNPQEQAWKTLKSETANTYYEDYANFIKAVKTKARQKNLTKMYEYLNH